mgnify:CR=1 FL=1
MDIIFLNNLKFDIIIGIFDWERENKQTIILDIEMASDITLAAKYDDIQHALDYKAVYDRIKGFIENSQCYLVETLVTEVAAILQNEFQVSWLKIKLNKKGILGPDTDVGVIIERGVKSA